MNQGKVTVHHWHHDDGRRVVPIILRKPGQNIEEFHEDLVGWHCWAYADDRIEFENWMQRNMKGDYEAIHRFNSGDPMFTVFIQDEEDAALFKLTWL